jgi:16S rRNA (guanine527-N7)-methyltransferase
VTTPWHTLEDVLAEAQRLGWLGVDDLDAVIDHSRRFLDGLTATHGRILDLGTGPGIPGLILARERPELQLVLLDRRSARVDFLNRAIAALGWGNRVTAICAEAPDAAGGIGFEDPFDAVVARSFGDPAQTLRSARPFLGIGGRLGVSEPPHGAGSRWPTELLVRLGMSGPEVRSGVAWFHVEHSPR